MGNKIYKMDFKEIIFNFKVSGDFLSCEKYGNGHINETYLVQLKEGNSIKKYILQKINNHIFKDVEGLMNNIVYVTNFIQDKLRKQNIDPSNKTLTVIYTKDDKPYFKINESYYRLYIYIDNTVTFQIVKSSNDFEKCALGFGEFYNLLSGFDASKLVEVIPDFHNTKKRYQDFLLAVRNDKCDRVKTCLEEIKFIQDREKYYNLIVDMLEKNAIPLRVTHNDTKLNNILFDEKTKDPMAVIDLDTIMPGSICYDFGDSIRFGTNTSFEDEKDLSKVHFDFNLYKIYLNAFLSSLGNSITQTEKNNLALGSIMMTIECGMRFLADYLEGDHYFHTSYINHNLIRARTQIKLVAEMEKSFDKMNSLIQ